MTPDPLPAILAETRRRFGLTLKEMGALLGLDRSAIWRVEHGRAGMTKAARLLLKHYIEGRLIPRRDVVG